MLSCTTWRLRGGWEVFVSLLYIRCCLDQMSYSGEIPLEQDGNIYLFMAQSSVHQL